MRIVSFLATACALAVAVSSSNAAILVGATSVQIKNIFSVPSQQYLQVGEFLAYQAGTYIDAAAASNGGSAFSPDQWDATHGADKAIDGNKNTDFYNTAGIFHSRSNAGGLLTINFLAPTDLQGVAIYGRTDGGFNVRDIYQITVFAGSSALYVGKLDATAGNGAVTSFVPEPAAWMIMVGGFGLVGVAARRRRKVFFA